MSNIAKAITTLSIIGVVLLAFWIYAVVQAVTLIGQL